MRKRGRERGRRDEEREDREGGGIVNNFNAILFVVEILLHEAQN